MAPRYKNRNRQDDPDACQLALRAGFLLFHGIIFRKVTSGQLPVVCLKSTNRGKSQGKSSVGRLVMASCSNWKKNKMSYSLAKETIKKRASFTTCLLYFDDVKSDKFISNITEGYDDGEVYETKEVNIKYIQFQFGQNPF